VFLLKSSSKRKRKHNEIEEVKQEEEELKRDKQGFLHDSKRRKEQEQSLIQENCDLKQLEGLVHQLHSQGIIDD
jgi:hypothetical protein